MHAVSAEFPGEFGLAMQDDFPACFLHGGNHRSGEPTQCRLAKLWFAQHQPNRLVCELHG